MTYAGAVPNALVLLLIIFLVSSVIFFVLIYSFSKNKNFILAMLASPLLGLVAVILLMEFAFFGLIMLIAIVFFVIKKPKLDNLAPFVNKKIDDAVFWGLTLSEDKGWAVGFAEIETDEEVLKQRLGYSKNYQHTMQPNMVVDWKL